VRRAVASTVAVVVIIVAAVIDGDALTLISCGVVIVLMLALTATGVGSVLGWALRLTLSQIAAVGTLLIRALPVVLLTVLVFFNT
jgi:hypothetical protein